VRTALVLLFTLLSHTLIAESGYQIFVPTLGMNVPASCQNLLLAPPSHLKFSNETHEINKARQVPEEDFLNVKMRWLSQVKEHWIAKGYRLEQVSRLMEIENTLPASNTGIILLGEEGASASLRIFASDSISKTPLPMQVKNPTFVIPEFESETRQTILELGLLTAEQETLHTGEAISRALVRFIDQYQWHGYYIKLRPKDPGPLGDPVIYATARPAQARGYQRLGFKVVEDQEYEFGGKLLVLRALATDIIAQSEFSRRLPIRRGNEDTWDPELEREYSSQFSLEHRFIRTPQEHFDQLLSKTANEKVRAAILIEKEINALVVSSLRFERPNIWDLSPEALKVIQPGIKLSRHGHEYAHPKLSMKALFKWRAEKQKEFRALGKEGLPYQDIDPFKSHAF
jgi:hypothetical protein